MISLARYLKTKPEGEETPYLRAIDLLLQGLELHTLDYNKEDHAHFQSELARLEERLSPELAGPDLLKLIGAVIRIFQTYNRQTGVKLRAQFAELQSIISTFTSAVAAMVSASDASLRRLGEIRSQLGTAETIEDLRTLKAHLSDCLNHMAGEVEQYRRNSAANMEGMAKGSRELEQSLQCTLRPVPDPVTGLAARPEAEGVLTRLALADSAAVAAIFVVKRLKQVNARFGREVGDALLSRLSTYLGSGMNSHERIYRWSGPALLAVITRDVSFDLIRRDIGRLIGAIPEYEVNVGPRTAIIPISVGWALFPVTRPAARFINQLDVFVNSQGTEDSYIAR